MKKIIILLWIITTLSACSNDAFLSRFDGLEPKANYLNYRIYDLVEQKGLACAEALEFLDEDENFQYYFNCLKSDQIFFVSDEEVIKIKHVYAAKLIDLDTLFTLNLIDRMPKVGQ